MSYIDGFIVPVPKKNIGEYKKIARMAGKIWKQYGALAYTEALADDVPAGKITSFPKAVKLEPDEVVVFAYIVYKSRKDRDAIMKKVMADKRFEPYMNKMPFDMKRMIFGGFKAMIEI